MINALKNLLRALNVNPMTGRVVLSGDLDVTGNLNGIPVTGNGIPLSMGQYKYFYVDGKYGSDSSPNGSIDAPYATIAKAITVLNARINWSATRWSNNDIIVIAPGVYVENITSLPYGATVVGIGDAFDLDGQRGVTVKPASGYPVNVTSCINTHIHNVCFESPDTSACFRVQNLNRSILSHCMFTGVPGASPTTVYGLRVYDATPGDLTGDMTGSKIIDCIFQVIENGIHIVVDNASSKQASGNVIEYCIIRGCTVAGIHFDVNSVPAMTVVNHCVVGDNSTTLALGMDDDTDKVTVSNTNFKATANDPATGSGLYNNCYLNGGLIA